MKKAYDWLKLAENSTSRKDCTLLCSNVGYLVLKLYYYHINKGPFTDRLEMSTLARIPNTSF